MTLEQIKQELGYFAPGVCKLNPGVMPNQIARAETLLGLVFPHTFCEILSEFNGGTFEREPLPGVPPVALAVIAQPGPWLHQADVVVARTMLHLVEVGADG